MVWVGRGVCVESLCVLHMVGFVPRGIGCFNWVFVDVHVVVGVVVCAGGWFVVKFGGGILD